MVLATFIQAEHFTSSIPKIYISFIKRWSKAESFTIFLNHVYPSKKILCLHKNVSIFLMEAIAVKKRVKKCRFKFFLTFLFFCENARKSHKNDISDTKQRHTCFKHHDLLDFDEKQLPCKFWFLGVSN